MQSKQRQRIIARHKSSLYQHGYGPQSLYWQDGQVQQLRFEVLLRCGIKSGDSVLDVGCGLADLKYYLDERGIEVDYHGVDLSPDLVEAAQTRDPQLSLVVGDLFDLDPPAESYDWVLLSGALNEPLGDNGEYMARCITRMYQVARKGIAFNLLNADYGWSEQQLYQLQPYSPADVIKLLQKLSTDVCSRDDYLETDVSYFVWKSAKFRP